MSDDSELLAEFLAEGRENLARLETELLSFEGNGGSPEMLAATFRTAHTIKGNAGFFGFSRLQELMHAAENLLSRMRDGELVLTSPIVSLLLDCVDAATSLFAAIEASGTEGDGDHSALTSALAGVKGDAPVAVAAKAEHVETGPTKLDTAVRVDTAVLDRLVTLAGELVLVRNQLLQRSAGLDPQLARVVQRLDAVTSQMQEGVMLTRMQPVGSALAKLPRVVRDLAAELGKQVKLEITGEDTALDRAVVEAIRDPLTHLVRNAIDHGVETPDKRRAAGKDVQGTLAITASHAGGSVAIEIRDDGAGIDPQRIRARAVERGLIAPDARMTDTELTQLIFAPGFSTAEKVTSVSGRGVGMDVVRTNIEAIGGSVQISGAKGEGTVILLKIPLTLAIMPVLLVGAGDQRYAIPEAVLVEILRIDPDEGKLGIEYVHGAPVYRRAGELIPLVELAEALAGFATHAVATPALVAVVSVDGAKLGLVVDDLFDSEEIVVTPLAAPISVSCFGGATILGDGRVALIVDVARLAQGLGVKAKARAATVAVAESAAPSLLVVIGRERRYAIPLGEVSRLAHVATSAIERAGRREVIQYDGRLLPLLRLGDPTSDRATVVVHRDRIGLVVESIVDVFDGDLAIDEATAMPGVRGSMVIYGQSTDVVDVAALVEAS